MLSAADFPMVFPWMAEQSPGHQRERRLRRPTATCIARWEDDGGRTLNPPSLSRPPGPPVSMDAATVQWVVLLSSAWAWWS